MWLWPLHWWNMRGYGAWCRIEDTIAFARRMDVTRIGVATCLGLLQEAKLLTQVLRARGFEVYTVSCKVGAVKKDGTGPAGVL